MLVDPRLERPIANKEANISLTVVLVRIEVFNGGFSKYVEIFLRGFLANPLTLLSSENSLIVPRSRYAHMLIVSERGGRLGGRIFFAVPS